MLYNIYIYIYVIPLKPMELGTNKKVCVSALACVPRVQNNRFQPILLLHDVATFSRM